LLDELRKADSCDRVFAPAGYSTISFDS